MAVRLALGLLGLFLLFSGALSATSNFDNFCVILAISSDVRSGLIKRWTNLDCPSASPQSKWKGTWGVSGTCSGMNETTFFKTGCNLATKANVLGALRKYGIVPSDSRLYPIASVRNALQKSIGKKVVVTCNKNAFHGKSQIDNVWICGNREGTNITDCPHSDFSCPQSVLLPVFTTDMLVDSTENTVVDVKMVV